MKIIEAGWASFILSHVLFDENNECFTAIEVGWTDFTVDTYTSMKITRVSLQSKLDELLSFFNTYYSMKIIEAGWASFFLPHVLFDENNAYSMKIIEAGWASIIFPHVFFDENNACFTAIEAWWTSFIFPNVLDDENNAFHCNRSWMKDTCQQWNQFIQLRLKWNTRYFHWRIRVNFEISSSNFDCNETRVIFMGEYA